MSITFSFAKSPKAKADTAILIVHGKRKFTDSAAALDKQSKGLIKHIISTTPKFEGKTGQLFTITQPKGTDFERVICVGLGALKELNHEKAEIAGGKLALWLKNAGVQKAVLFADTLKGLKKIDEPAVYAHLLAGIDLRSYTFKKYKTTTKKAKALVKFTTVGDVHSKIKARFLALHHVNQGVFLARDLVNEPPNHLYPDAYAKLIRKELKPLGVEIEVLDEKKMDKLGMGAIMAVGKGSERQPRMVVMRWNGSGKNKGAKKDVPLALVGKGVTFDTGGISIKPSGGMDEMKMDMGGSAAVVGTMKAIALRKAKANIVAVVGLAENMPSHNAYRPGDIIKSYSGKTIEVLNTDAEGRLVLADCLTHIQKTYKPGAIIDLATLTGAMMVALGHEYCGTFVNDDTLWKGLEHASAETSEKLWRMPLDKVWKDDMVSNVADLQNLGKSGRYAGACTAAGFLEHFIEDGVKWAHMDIAGTAWSKKDKPTVPKYGSGFGVRVLDKLIENKFED